MEDPDVKLFQQEMQQKCSAKGVKYQFVSTEGYFYLFVTKAC